MQNNKQPGDMPGRNPQIHQADTKPADGVFNTAEEEHDELQPMPNAPIGVTSFRSSRRSAGIEIEGLGNLHEEIEKAKDADEGKGEKVVILHDVVKGFVKGRVIRISLLLPTYEGKQKDSATVARTEAKRLFDLGAIRMALGSETDATFIQMTDESESEAVQRERQGRYAAEQELERIKKEFADTKDNVFDEVFSQKNAVNAEAGNVAASEEK